MMQKISPAVRASAAPIASTTRLISACSIIVRVRYQLPEAPPPPNEPPPPEKPPPPENPPDDPDHPEDPHEPGTGKIIGPRPRPRRAGGPPLPRLAATRISTTPIRTSSRLSIAPPWVCGRW